MRSRLRLVRDVIRSPWCVAVGHCMVWSDGVLSCSRHGCRVPLAKAQDAIVDALDSFEGAVFLAKELRK